MPATILVGVDDHATARDTVALGAALATALGEELATVNVYPFDPLAGSLGSGAPWDASLRGEARDIVQRAGEGCPIPYQPIIVTHPSMVGGLPDAAKRTGAKLLVVGSSDRGAVGRIALGSHSERVLHDSPCVGAVAPHGLAAAGWKPAQVAAAYDGSEDARHAVDVAWGLAPETVGATGA